MTSGSDFNVTVYAALAPVLVAAEQRLGLALDGHQRDQLLEYVSLLTQWSKTYNLTAIREPRAIMSHHVADCLAVAAPLGRALNGRSYRRLADVGSGAGLPGIVLAVALPSLDVTCVESVGKKAAFIRHAAAALGLANVEVEARRVEEIAYTQYDLITSRAFSTLAAFVKMTSQLLEPNGHWLAMKGKTPSEELSNLPADVNVFHVEQLASIDEVQRCLIWMNKRVSASS